MEPCATSLLTHKEQYPNDFGRKREIDNFGPCNVLLAFATNIAVLLMTASGTHKET